jgi:hypothetical protein
MSLVQELKKKHYVVEVHSTSPFDDNAISILSPLTAEFSHLMFLSYEPRMTPDVPSSPTINDGGLA